MMRREVEDQNRKILNWKPCKRRGKGRPKTRWLDEVESDLKNMEINNWWKLVDDRRKWKIITKTAQQHPKL